MSIKWRRTWFPVWYGFCPTEKDFRKAMKNSTDPDFTYPETPGCVTVYDDDLGQRCVLVTFNIDWEKNYDVGIGLLVHECVHIVDAVINKMADSYPSEEFRAYATQGVFTELRQDISDYLKRKGKS